MACASAQLLPYYGGYYGAPVVPVPVASQYHAQDVLGQAAYGYAYPGQAATNYRDAFGNQVGSYAYINPEGKEVRVSYTADSRGFRVLSNDLPQSPVSDLKAPVFDGQAPVFDGKAPEPVQDTPEVVAAKAEFFKLYNEVYINIYLYLNYNNEVKYRNSLFKRINNYLIKGCCSCRRRPRRSSSC